MWLKSNFCIYALSIFHRKILSSFMYRQLNSKQRDVMFTILLMANHKTNEWKFKGKLYKVKPGQFVTSLDAIQKNCAKDVSIQNIRTALNKLKEHGFLTWELINKQKNLKKRAKRRKNRKKVEKICVFSIFFNWHLGTNYFILKSQECWYYEPTARVQEGYRSEVVLKSWRRRMFGIRRKSRWGASVRNWRL